MASISEIQQYDKGRKQFAEMLRYFMDGNGWSHPTMISIAKSVMGSEEGGWLHSSQISGLRSGKLISPGPRVFVALQRLNKALHDYATNKTLIPNTTSSKKYSKAKFIHAGDGKPPSTGWFVQVFTGETNYDAVLMSLPPSAKEMTRKRLTLMLLGLTSFTVKEFHEFKDYWPDLLSKPGHERCTAYMVQLLRQTEYDIKKRL